MIKFILIMLLPSLAMADDNCNVEDAKLELMGFIEVELFPTILKSPDP